MRFPKQLQNVTWEKEQDSYTLVHPSTKELFQIDAIAFMIWAQCDGKTSMDRIVDIFALGNNREVVKASINGVLERLSKAGFIKWT